ncbi:condensation domain-containing protein, partial [Myxococcus sp. AM010]|uniref:condensation domain-containing protein n=1 Tax=Myxococcus sp. AM010 TaxID=2745138 RepID=UPI00182DE04E
LLHGPLDVEALSSALRWLLSRHSVLRLAVPSDEGRPAPFLLEVPARVLRHQKVEVADEVQPWLREEIDTPFSMEHGPLYRFSLLSLSAEHHVLSLVFHHLAVDGLSLSILVRELGVAYRAFQQGAAPELPPVTLDWADVAVWQRSAPVLASEDAQLEYWKQQLTGAPAVLSLPTDKARPPVLSPRGRLTRREPLSIRLNEAVRALCRERQVTPFMVFYAAFAALLRRYSQQSDFCVGTPVAGRTHPATEDVVGTLVNTLVLRSQVHADSSFDSLLSEVRATTLEAMSHQDVPFERVVRALGVERTSAHSPLFQVMFDLYQQGDALTGAFPGLDARPLELDIHTTHFDLSLTVHASTEGFGVTVQYSTDLFEHDSIQRLVGHYLRLLEGALAAPSAPLASVDLLSASERQQVLFSFNDTSRPFDSLASVSSLWTAQVAR